MRLECGAAAPTKAVKLGIGPLAELLPQGLEERPLQSRHGGVVDEGRLAAGGKPALEGGIGNDRGGDLGEARHGGGIDEQRFEKEAGGRRIGRDLAAIRGEERVHRAEPEERGAEGGNPLRGLSDVGVVADAEIARRAQAVELRRRAPEPGLVAQRVRQEAARRRRNHRRMRLLAAGADVEPVVAWPQRRQREGGALRLDAAAAFAHGATLVGDAPFDDRPLRRAQRHGDGATGDGGDEARREGAFQAPHAFERGASAAVARNVEAEAGEDRDPRFRARSRPRAPSDPYSARRDRRAARSRRRGSPAPSLRRVHEEGAGPCRKVDAVALADRRRGSPRSPPRRRSRTRRSPRARLATKRKAPAA